MEDAKPREPSPLSQFALKEGDTFLVADAHGDVSDHSEGLFRDDTRVVSELTLRVGGQRAALLSSCVSQDNLYFTAHMTNEPLPSLGDDPLPRAVMHIERKRFVWKGSIFERICLENFSELHAATQVKIQFDADFRDIFEIRGQKRARRGEQLPVQIHERGVVRQYRGLDGVTRAVSISYSRPPQRLDAREAVFDVALDARETWALYLELGAEPGEPSRARFRQSAARAWRSLRLLRQSGARLRTSGRLFQTWLDKSRADLALLTTQMSTGPYPYAGIPWFSTPFGRDAIITAMQTLWFDPSLARGVLAYLAEHQARETSAFRDSEPGKIMHETRKGEMAAANELPFGRYYGGVDTTPLFLMLAGAYARRTGDRGFIESLWPALAAAAGWLEDRARSHPDGLIAYARGATTGLANQGWKDSYDSVFHADGTMAEGPIALVEVQGYACRAYRDMSELAAWLANDDAASHWRQRAQSMSRNVERLFWLEDLSFYALAIDGHGRPCRVRASNAGHLLFAGVPRQLRAAEVARQLLSSAFDTGWGVRTLAADTRNFNPMSYHNGSVWPHDVALCAAGMARYGEREGSVRLLSNLFEAASHFGMRLPELFCGFQRAPGESPVAYPVACLPQAWASGSVFMLLQACLGLHVDGRRNRVLIERPALPAGIDQLRLRGLTVGEHRIDLAFQRVGSRLVAFVEGDRGTRKVKVDVRA